ncbi:hypothetical protein [Nonomuraea solani]|nr:hypothetical protein [Nonomuraea solani]
MPADVPRDAVVIRFRPTMPEDVLRSAGKWYRFTGVYGLSVFTDVAHAAESEHDVIGRLLKASEMSNIDPAKNKKFYICTSAGKIMDAGFSFRKDGDDDERPEHYTVDLGEQPTLEVVERFLEAFDIERRR